MGLAALANAFSGGPVRGDPATAPKLALLRGVTAVPAHAAIGAIMGFYLGLSYRRHSGRALLLGAAWGAPVALHGAYDFVLFLNRRAGGLLFRLWYWVLLYEISLARRRLRTLRAV